MLKCLKTHIQTQTHTHTLIDYALEQHKDREKVTDNHPMVLWGLPASRTPPLGVPILSLPLSAMLKWIGLRWWVAFGVLVKRLNMMECGSAVGVTDHWVWRLIRGHIEIYTRSGWQQPFYLSSQWSQDKEQKLTMLQQKLSSNFLTDSPVFLVGAL